MTKAELEHIIDRYLKGKATQQEVKLVEQFYQELAEQQADWGEDKKETGEKIYRNILQKIERKQNRLKYQISVAAGFLLLVGISYFMLRTNHDPSPSISYDNKEIVVTAEDSQKSVLLSDGTYILLNPRSTISYFDDFTVSRKVHLSGEAWFDVQKDENLSFKVITDEVTTTVLGTSFHINTQPDLSKVEVRVTSGRVQISSKDKEIAILEKDEQLAYEDGSYKIERDERIADLTALPLPQPGSWKLADITMGEAISFIEKRWDTTITIENQDIKNCPLYASFNAEDSMEDVLMVLCTVTQSDFRKEGESVMIYGQGCTTKNENM